MKVYIDFEYKDVTNRYLNLVSASLLYEDTLETFWLYNNQAEKRRLKELIVHLNKQDATFVAYNVIAEARSFISLGLDPTNFYWIDLYLEWRMLTNHNNNLGCGDQLIDGKVKKVYPKNLKYVLTDKEYDELDKSKPSYGLMACTYKLLGIKGDQEYKDKMRDLVLSLDIDVDDETKKSILEYNKSDIKDLRQILEKMIVNYQYLLPKFEIKFLGKEMRKRGYYAALSAIMESHGYPINYSSTVNFIKNVASVLKDCAEDINSQNLDLKPFRWNKRENRYSLKVKEIRDWVSERIKNRTFKRWQTTEKGFASLSLENWTREFAYSHDYPRDNLGAQIVRYLKLRQSLNGFMPDTKATKKKFIDFIGPDKRVRPYMGIYGSQSGRSQPSATGFIPLKAAWMRSLIMPDEGRAITSIDYGSQEFLISAIISGDKNMFDAYRSGDPYLYFAKLAGTVPMDGTKEEYSEIRNLFKSTCLGVSYNMGHESLAKKLSLDTGKDVSPSKAQELIDQFYLAYPEFSKWNTQNKEHYTRYRYLKAPCGWTMFGDNPNWRSVNNFPIQATAASIMRKAVDFCYSDGLTVIYTLHDALYIEHDSDDLLAIDTLYIAMKEAFKHYFEGDKKDWAGYIRQDIDSWSPDFGEEGTHEISEAITPDGRKVKRQNIYVDPRSKNDYERFKKYM